ncbi:nuclear transport factor 2 family protein [Catellatospora sichuanensis]|uniref:nuclear transport factor 2 family protein n=1 Tax=Catellatospora sichuanensis TaxID=1969805 RepID=UPI0011829CB2|nr:nuclear transport factor 2 family protein [Catellatospora sichuanensis]
MTTPDIAPVITAMYQALGDRPAFDAHLHPDLTIWESDAPAMLHGVAQLDTLRDQRAAARPASDGPVSASVTVAPEDLSTETWGDTGLARYVLRARHADGSPDAVFRVTDVLRRDDTGWRIVHHHAEAVS